MGAFIACQSPPIDDTRRESHLSTRTPWLYRDSKYMSTRMACYKYPFVGGILTVDIWSSQRPVRPTPSKFKCRHFYKHNGAPPPSPHNCSPVSLYQQAGERIQLVSA